MVLQDKKMIPWMDTLDYIINNGVSTRNRQPHDPIRTLFTWG